MNESLEQSSLMDGRFSSIEEKVYKNNVHHLYGIDEMGKKRHISWAEVADYHGYTLQDAQKPPVTEITEEDDLIPGVALVDSTLRNSYEESRQTLSEKEAQEKEERMAAIFAHPYMRKLVKYGVQEDERILEVEPVYSETETIEHKTVVSEDVVDKPKSIYELSMPIINEFSINVELAKQSKQAANIALKALDSPEYKKHIFAYEASINKIEDALYQLRSNWGNRWTPEFDKRVRLSLDLSLLGAEKGQVLPLFAKPVIETYESSAEKLESIYNTEFNELAKSAAEAILQGDELGRKAANSKLQTLIRERGETEVWDVDYLDNENEKAAQLVAQLVKDSREQNYKGYAYIKKRVSDAFAKTRKALKRGKKQDGEGKGSADVPSLEAYRRRKFNERKSPEEYAKTRGKISLFIGAGMLALSLGRGIAMHDSNYSAEARPTKNPTPPVVQEAAPSNPSTNLGTEPVSSPQPQMEKLNFRGDTIWYHSQVNLVRQGNQAPSLVQIDTEKNRILELNHLTEEQARHLSIGYEFQE